MITMTGVEKTKKDQVLISIIIPVYNAVRTLDKCVDSVISQTHRNLEIILVDDGSTDGCYDKCDYYAVKDSRVYVIHKINGGLSSARNAGLDIANGEYIGFVDSDDYIDPRMYENLLNWATKNNDDITICGVHLCNMDGTVNRMYPRDVNLVHNSDEAIRNALLGIYYQGHAWDKLYRKDIIDTERYDENIRFREDLPFLISVLTNAKQISYHSDPLYYYVIHKDSLTGVQYNEEMLSVFVGYDSIDKKLLDYNRGLIYYSRASRMLCCLYLFGKIYASNGINKYKSKNMIRKEFLKAYCWKSLLLIPRINDRIKVIFAYIHPKLYHLLSIAMEEIKRM